MIHVSATVTIPVEVDVRVDDDQIAMAKAVEAAQAVSGGRPLDIKHLETIDDDESIPAGEARLKP